MDLSLRYGQPLTVEFQQTLYISITLPYLYKLSFPANRQKFKDLYEKYISKMWTWQYQAVLSVRMDVVKFFCQIEKKFTRLKKTLKTYQQKFLKSVDVAIFFRFVGVGVGLAAWVNLQLIIGETLRNHQIPYSEECKCSFCFITLFDKLINRLRYRMACI